MTLKTLIVSSELDILEKTHALIAEYDLSNNDFVYLIEDFTNTKANSENNNIFVIRDFAVHDEVNVTLERISANHKIKAVISNDEFSLFISAIAREKFNIEGIKCYDARKFRDKKMMKEIAQKNKIPTPKKLSIDSISKGSITFPFIIKPRSLAGSVGVLIINNASEIPDGLNSELYQYKDMDTSQNLVEEYINEEIYHIDCVVLNNEINFITACAYQGTPLEYLKGKMLGGISLPVAEVDSIWLPFTQKLKSAFSFPDGVYHIEAFGGNIEPTLLELAYRPGGGPITESILHTYNIDLRIIHLAAQLGLFPKIGKRSIDMGYAYLLYPKDHISTIEKRVTHVQMPQLDKLPTLKDYKIAKKDELASGEFYNHKDCLGMFIFSGEREPVLEDYNQVIKDYKVFL